MSACVYSLSDHKGRVRYFGAGPSENPLEAVAVLRSAGLGCGVGSWLSLLDGKPPVLTVLFDNLWKKPATKLASRLASQWGDRLINQPLPVGSQPRPCFVVFSDLSVMSTPDLMATNAILGHGRNAVEDGLGFTIRGVRQIDPGDRCDPTKPDEQNSPNNRHNQQNALLICPVDQLGGVFISMEAAILAGRA